MTAAYVLKCGSKESKKVTRLLATKLAKGGSCLTGPSPTGPWYRWSPREQKWYEESEALLDMWMAGFDI